MISDAAFNAAFARSEAAALARHTSSPPGLHCEGCGRPGDFPEDYCPNCLPYLPLEREDDTK